MTCKKKVLFPVIIISCAISLQSFAQEINNDYIDSGFIFYDGKYIEAPYKVEMRDLAVFINGIQITSALKIKPKIDVLEDPGVPLDLTTDMTLGEMADIKWQDLMPFYFAKLYYLWATYNKKEAQDRMIEYYRNLPNVAKAERVRGEYVKLWDHSGNSLLVDNYVSDLTLQEPPTMEEIQSNIYKLVVMYRKQLLKGNSYFFFANGTIIILTDRKAVNVLREMDATLTDPSLNLDEKKTRLHKIELIPEENDQLTSSLIENYLRNPQFEKRLAEATQSIINKYGVSSIRSYDW
ncbi:hypothetical protein CEE37_05820 [candidate division LCP-89 bacterium B3_LCP]|uniref:Uncharacterized protein n=1 Tax=candidate division LCP-89 bacterium B3_LCP TaxID=2012998 RepID=A0A532V1T2_UNCL8|nr:MAG: hypothetical protein CEE37_05820 [candidate division LCP-89 bacterium B3_LCP]